MRGETAVIALALSPDGAWAAAARVRGCVAIIDRKARAVARMLVGPGLPVWSVAFMPDNRTLVTSGSNRVITRFGCRRRASTLVKNHHAIDKPLIHCWRSQCGYTAPALACNQLAAAGRRSPHQADLAGIFGADRDVCPATISPRRSRASTSYGRRKPSKMFEVGPAEYTPGTKMPAKYRLAG